MPGLRRQLERLRRPASEKPAGYFHIGMHKTGTTTIQAAMYASRKVLAKRGIYYPDMDQNHSLAMSSMLSPRLQLTALHIRQGRNSLEDIERFNEENHCLLEKGLSARKWRKLLVSGESMSTLGSGGVENLKQLFDDRVSSYRVVFYIRPPASFINSDVQERVKNGATLEDIENNPSRPQYRQRLQPFLQTFGKDVLEIRLYSQALLRGGGLMHDFCDAIDEPGLADELRLVARWNRSWSHGAVQIMDAYNVRFPLIVEEPDGSRALNPKRPTDGILRNILAHVPGQRFSMELSLMASLLEKNREDIEWMERIYGDSIRERSASRSGGGLADQAEVLPDHELKPVADELHALSMNLSSAPERALDSCDKLLEWLGENAELRFQRGVILTRKNQLQQALTEHDKAIELDPTHARAWYQSAIVMARTGDLMRAAAAARHSVQLSPETAAFRTLARRVQQQLWLRQPKRILRNISSAFGR